MDEKIESLPDKDKYDKLAKEHAALGARHDEMCKKLEALTEAHKELQSKQPGFKKPYEYKEGDNQCPPVPKVIGAICPRCQYEYGGKAKKDKEPHPVA